jgi:rubrerythrin
MTIDYSTLKKDNFVFNVLKAQSENLSDISYTFRRLIVEVKAYDSPFTKLLTGQLLNALEAISELSDNLNTDIEGLAMDCQKTYPRIAERLRTCKDPSKIIMRDTIH